MMIKCIRSLKDNYIWAILDDLRQVVIVDPGDAKPVIDFLQQEKAKLCGILITHHHWDHTNGVLELLKNYPVPIFAPREKLAFSAQLVSENDRVNFNEMDLTFKVLDIPGHTNGHVAFYGHELLFCGDTLFSAGCGRIFEGTPCTMYSSLEKIKQLPNTTQIFPAHEYTLANLFFSKLVEPENIDIQNEIKRVHQILQKNEPSLPSTLLNEKKINPFLRCDMSAVKQFAENISGKFLTDEVEVFAEIRKAKDNFKFK